MITWLGPPNLGERFAVILDILWRSGAYGLAMTVVTSAFNVGSMAIWRERADIIIYPAAPFWLSAATFSFLEAASVVREQRLRIIRHWIIAATLALPLAWISLVYWQLPLLIGQSMLAQSIGDFFR